MLSTFLKHSTAASHAAVEHVIDLPSRLYSRSDYTHLLEQFWGLYAPLEACLITLPVWAELGVDIAPRLKLPALERDLRALGRTSAEIAALPTCHRLPRIDTLATALGCLYVLEGATLGGQIIARMAHQQLGLTAENGCAFFTSYDTSVGPMWREFRALLDSADVDENVVVQAAEATFTAFGQWVGRKEMHDSHA